MPRSFEPREIAKPGDFSLQERVSVQGEQQANVTFRVDTTGHRPLGKRGELSGIAKLDPGDAREHVERARDHAMEEAMTRLGQIAIEINHTLNTDNTLTEDQRRRLQQQRDWCIAKTNSENRIIVQMDLPVLGHYANDPVIQKAITLHRQVLQQGGNDAIFQSLGIQQGEERGTAMLTRAVGTAKLDQLLGTDVISEERFGVDEQGRTIGISVRVDGFGVVGKLPENREYLLDVDYSRPEIQKGLYDLEVIDYITGQIDRHPGNIFIDPETGVVKGIDNDLCFPSISREQMLGDLRDAGGKPVYNKPLFMHEDTAGKIEQLDPEELRDTLSTLKYPGRGEKGKLTTEEIEGAITRLNELKQHVQDLRRTGHVVTEFNKETYDEAIQHQKDSYAQQRAQMMTVSARSMDTVEDPMVLDMTHKTSYIGSILCEQRKTDLALQENIGKLRLEPDGVRQETNSTGKSNRSEEHLEFSRLENVRREELLPIEREPMQEEFQRLNERVSRMERRLERLEHPNLWDRFKAIWHGGVEGAKRAFEGKRQEALERIDGLNEVLEHNLNLALDGSSEERWEQARRNVQNARLQREQGQNPGLNQSQNVNEDLVLTPEKLGIQGNAPEKFGFTFKKPSKVGLDEGVRTDVIDEQGITEPKPELQKKDSVRDLMKSRDGDMEPKVRNQQDIEDDTVRSNVTVKKTDVTTAPKGPSHRTQ
jgi:hypothetical protein